MRRNAQSVWANPTLATQARKPRSRRTVICFGALVTVLAAAFADAVVIWTGALVRDTRLGAALLGLVGALMLSHRWSLCRPVVTVWWSCLLIVVALTEMAFYVWAGAGLSPVDPHVIAALSPILPIAVCVAMIAGYIWRLCARLVEDRHAL